MMVVLLIVGVVCCILAEAFFSSSEIAIISVDRSRIREQALKGSKLAKMIMDLLRKPEWLLGTTLLGTNLSTVTAGVLGTLLVIEILGKEYEFAAIVFVSPLILVFAEILPKTIAQARANWYAQKIVVPLSMARTVLFPFVWLLAQISGVFTSFVAFTSIKRNPLMTREDLEFALRTSGRRGGLKKIERQMIYRIFEFKDTTVDEVMIPLIEVVAVQVDKSLRQAVELALATGISRLPVYRDRIDDMIGVLNAMDILNVDPGNQRPLNELLKKPLYVPASKPIKEMLVTFNRREENLAIVVDEYGGAIGIVTVEDILEEVVGEIVDEHDVRRLLYREVAPGTFIVDARMEVDQLRERLGIELPDGDFETLAGFLLEHLQSIPRPGAEFRLEQLIFEVRRADDRAIHEVLIRRLPHND